MVAALTTREIVYPISRKRARRVMRAERLLRRTVPPANAASSGSISGSNAPTSFGTWTR